MTSRYTSLLVLESPAMFQAFGLKRQRLVTEWTGEEATDKTESSGATAVRDSDQANGRTMLGPGSDSEVVSGVVHKNPACGPGNPSCDMLIDDKRYDFATTGGELVRAPRATTAPSLAGQAAAPVRELAPPPPSKMEIAPAPTSPVAPLGTSPPSSEPPPDARRTWIPMRRVWERVGEVTALRTQPTGASAEAIAQAERDLSRNENRRGAVKTLYTLYALSGDLEHARQLAERWSEKEPLDPEALTARADLAARGGDRETAIRILGSVVDVRPGDVKAQQRLARPHRWAGHPALGCQHNIAIAQIAAQDPALLAGAVRCSRETEETSVGDELLDAAETAVRSRALQILSPQPKDGELSGDLRVEATWSPGPDLDLALLDPDDNRISWLGAPTRAVISATSVTSTNREGLALRGGKPGEYVIEIVRTAGSGRSSGTPKITAANTTRTVPFSLDGPRAAAGLITLRTEPRLVRAW